MTKEVDYTFTDAAGNKVKWKGLDRGKNHYFDFKVVPADSTAPRLQGITVDAAGKKLTLAYDEALKGGALNANQFVVTVAGKPVVALQNSNITIEGQNVKITLPDTTTVHKGEQVTVSYTKPNGDQTTGVIQDAAGNDAANIPDSKSVTNNSEVVVKPTATPQPVAKGNPAAPTTAEDKKQGVVAKLYESALPNGSKAQGGTTTATGTITAENLAAGQKLALAAPPTTEKVYSGGQLVVWTLSSDKQILTAAAGNKPIATISLTKTADGYDYTVTLQGAIDHTGKNNEALLAKPKVRVVDASGQKVPNTAETNLTIKVMDDKPVANNKVPQVKAINLAESAPPTASVKKVDSAFNTAGTNLQIPSDKPNRVEWTGSGGENAYIELTKPKDFKVENASQEFDFGRIVHGNHPTSEFFPAGGVTVKTTFAVNLANQGLQEISANIKLFVEEVTGRGRSNPDDYLVLQNLNEEITIHGEKYSLSITGAGKKLKDIYRETNGVVDPAQYYLSSKLQKYQGRDDVVIIKTKEGTPNGFDLKATLIPVSDGAKALFAGSVTGNADVSADGTNNGEWTVDNVGTAGYQVRAAGTPNVFNITKNGQDIGTFTGKADGKYAFTAAAGAKTQIADNDFITFNFAYSDKDQDQVGIKVKFDLKNQATTAPSFDLDGLYPDHGVIDLSASTNDYSANGLQINAQKVQHVGTGKTLYIKGDAGDKIQLGDVVDTSTTSQKDGVGAWTKGATMQVGSDTYALWRHSDGSTLFIETELTVL